MTQFDKCIGIVDKSMRELGVKYAFISGTALGLGRTGNCMDFDTDVDFCIPVSERPNLQNIKYVLFRNGLKQISEMKFGERIEGIGFSLIENDTEWVELDFLHARDKQVWYSAFVGHDQPWITKVYPKRMWNNLEHIYAYGIKCPVFHPIQEYLEMLYGKDWKIPNQFYFNQELFRKTEARHYDFDLVED